MRFRLRVVLLLTIYSLCGPYLRGSETAGSVQKRVYVLPIRDDIMPPMVYLVRRGVKEAMEAKADLLVLDMDTNGGRVDTTREIISILNQFQGDTVTYVNKDAFSAGAFIAVATKKIYMAPESVIGAAAPVILSPGGDPPKPLISSGTIETIDRLLAKLGYGDAVRKDIEPTGVERLAMWINMISPLLLIVGIAGIYIEFKTPGFGLPGIIGIIAFALYFFGGYIAGLSGLEWIAVFLVGLALVALELLVFPGTVALALVGAVLMLVALVMAMVDVYPGMPALPSFKMLKLPLGDLFIAFVGGAMAVWVLSRWLPRTPIYGKLVSRTVSGTSTVAELEQKRKMRVGLTGVAVSSLRPGGKAQFGDEILDVITQGEMIDKGQRVK